MTVFEIVRALESSRKEGGSYILARSLSAKNGEDKVILVGYTENELLSRSLGLSDSELEPLVEPCYGSKYEEELEHAIIYGHYRPQYGLEISHEEAKSSVRLQVNKWLAFLDDKQPVIHGIGIEDIVMETKPVPARCPHCPDDHETNYVAFSALVVKPKQIELKDPAGLPIIAFLRHLNNHVVLDLLNRDGVFMFNMEEHDIDPSVTLSKDNWREFIMPEKAKVFAKYI